MANDYRSMVDKAKAFWSDVGKKNGWSLDKRGVTVWITDGKMVDSYVNPPNNKDISYIVDRASEKIISKIKG